MSGRVQEVFEQAVARPRDQREVFLAGACAADPELRAGVETLLSALDRAAGFMDNPTAPSPVPGEAATGGPSPLREGPGTRIGPYKVLQLIGEGGFGTVFMAEQTEPVVRRVALKIIKLGMDTRQVIARFEAERQALAMMDHPNIAKVFDAGATDTGGPFFVMELVKGDPITQYCDKNNLGMKQRLELFGQVCNAVQHAHTKGIIHRDIKPSNVLVTMFDGKPVPKVIDFGIAKATNARLTEKTLFTELRQLVGTPEYMSPEQAEASGVDIDTRSDIYSLGVLLYELLTGGTPFDSKRLRSAAYVEIQRIIREEEPDKPSTRLSTLKDTLASVAAHRQSEPGRMSGQVKGDLDWIVMKCLEKDRVRRYETANGLSADIARHLCGEAVLAAPPSTTYRLRKFARRHRVGVLAGGAIATALVLGTVGTTVGMIRAVRAEQQQRILRDQAEAARVSEAQQRTRAEANERKAKDEAAQADSARGRAVATTDFVRAALSSSDPGAGGRQDMLVTEAMTNAIERLDAGAFQGNPETEADLRNTIAYILDKNGRSAEAERLFEQALKIRRRLFSGDHQDVALSLNNVAHVRSNLGRAAEAEPLYVQALEMFQRLHKGDHADVAMGLSNLASARDILGRMDEAEALYQQSLEMFQRLFKDDRSLVATALNNLAYARQALGRPEEAAKLYQQALEMRQRLYPGDHPDVAVSLNNLGFVREAQGRPEEAEPFYQRALEMEQRLYTGDHPDLATALNNLGHVRLTLGRPAEGEPLIAQALEMQRRIYGKDHPSIATNLSSLARARRALGRAEESEALYLESLDMNRRLFKGDHPDIAAALKNIAIMRHSLGRVAEAEPLYIQALEMNQRLYAGDHPAVASSLGSLAHCLNAQGKREEAKPLITQATEMILRIHPPDHPDVKRALEFKKEICGE